MDSIYVPSLSFLSMCRSLNLVNVSLFDATVALPLSALVRIMSVFSFRNFLVCSRSVEICFLLSRPWVPISSYFLFLMLLIRLIFFSFRLSCVSPTISLLWSARIFATARSLSIFGLDDAIAFSFGVIE